MTSKSLVEDLQNPTLVSFLDFSRWVAAAVVFIGHLRNPLFVGYGASPSESRTLFIKGWYFVTGLHAEAVIVFFVLSGLLVAGIGFTKVTENRFSPVSYSIDRFSRLYVAFLPALLIGYTADCIGSQSFAEIGYWNQSHPMIAEKIPGLVFDQHLQFSLLASNALMLQHFVTDMVGSNHPMWTISCEFWFYVVFGIAAVIWMWRGAARYGAMVCLVGLFVVLGWRFPIYLGYWLLGLTIIFVPRWKWLRPEVTLMLFGATLCSARILQSHTDGSYELRVLKNYCVAATFALVIASFRGRSYRALEKTIRLNRFLADFSYSLYLLHFPLMLLILAVVFHLSKFEGIATGYSPASTEGWCVYALVILVIYKISWGFAQLTEARTYLVRRRLKSMLGVQSSRSTRGTNN